VIREKQKSDNLLLGYDRKVLQLVEAGEYETARWVAEESYEYSRNTFGDQHIETAKTLNNLAWVYDLLGQHKTAERLYSRSVDIKAAVFGEHSLELITTLENLTTLYLSGGEYDKSEILLHKMIDIVRHKPEPLCFREAVYLTQLAEIKAQQVKNFEAEQLYQKCIAFTERTMPTDHPNLGRAFANMADFYRSLGNCQRALFYYKRSLAVLRRSLPAKHPDVRSVGEKIGILASELNSRHVSNSGNG